MRIILCKKCNKEVLRYKRKNGTWSVQKYCADCLNSNILLRSPVDNKTKAELFLNRTNWQSARSSIQKHARMVFKRSDNLRECRICGYSNHFEVAHIKAVSDFNDNATVLEINDLSNLIALCPNHHWEYDNGLLII